ncbi:MAG: fumarylacetoacetate hydrolase family protein [Alphaproteobacteria bacterium]|nr:fumarylacetoacetate hydrolase family protein [Alphaproteobacteria bacterium]
MAWFALASYAGKGGRRSGIVFNGSVHDLAATWRAVNAGAKRTPDWVGADLDDVFGAWDRCGEAVNRFGEKAAKRAASGRLPGVIKDGNSRLLIPTRPRRIFCAAANYIEHANEMKSVLAKKTESNPYFFMKADSAAIGPNEPVVVPPQTRMLDWEVELGVVIGTTCRNVSKARALDQVAGYTIVNDVSARDLNKRTDFPFTFDWFQGKSFDTFAPIGPWIVPAACIRNPHKLDLKLAVNGKMMQDSNTDQLIFDIREQIAYLTAMLTLRPGDIIATGTPAGVGMGRGIFLKPGDVMTLHIEDVGTLENPVAAPRKERARR